MGLKDKKYPRELYPNYGSRSMRYPIEEYPNYAMRGKGKGFETYRKYSWMYQRFVKRKTYKEIAKEAGCSYATIWFWARRVGIPEEFLPKGLKGMTFPKEKYPNFGTRNKHISEKQKIKNRKASIKNWQNPEIRDKTIKSMIIAWEKRVESSGYPRSYFCPNFNFESIPIFKSLDRILHTRSRYGSTRAGEKKIGRYFVDFFNKKYQFIIEWNEKDGHYDNDSQLKEYDIKKRRYILARYPDYIYIIIKQSDWFKKDNLTEEIAGKIVDYILKKLEGR